MKISRELIAVSNYIMIIIPWSLSMVIVITIRITIIVHFLGLNCGK